QVVVRRQVDYGVAGRNPGAQIVFAIGSRGVVLVGARAGARSCHQTESKHELRGGLHIGEGLSRLLGNQGYPIARVDRDDAVESRHSRSEEHTTELQSLT